MMLESVKMHRLCKWALAVCGLPLFYLCAPVSCCLRNPAAKVYDMHTPRTAEERVAENFKVGCLGLITVGTCCNCCDCYDSDPKDL